LLRTCLPRAIIPLLLANHHATISFFRTCLPRAIIPLLLANHHATISFFHTDDSTSCGEDQMTAWSETASTTEQAAFPFDWSTARPIMVSVELLRDKLFTFRKPQYPDWVFAGTFDDLPDFDVGHGPFDDLEAVDTWTFEHDPTHSSYFPNNYHHNTNMVSTYLTADGGYLPLRYRTSLLPR
jgi:hypothetical protein